MKKEFLEIASVLTTHGTGGEIKIEYWCDSADVLKHLGTLYISGKEYGLTSVRPLNGNYALIKLDGVDSPETGVKLRGAVLCARRSDLHLPEGSFFISEIIGLPVIDEVSGRVYGTLEEVLFYQPHEIYSVKTENGTVLLPHVKEFVKRTDTEKGIYITPSEGFFD